MKIKKALVPYLKPSKLIHYGIWVLMLFLLSQRIPSWITNYRVEGKLVEPFVVFNAEDAPQTLPLLQKKQIIIFWATWCKPCELELSRFNRAVADKEISADSVVAVSVGEEPSAVFAEVRSRGYLFPVFADLASRSTQSLEVQATPQVYHVDVDRKVSYATMGVSPLAIMRARWFLR